MGAQDGGGQGSTFSLTLTCCIPRKGFYSLPGVSPGSEGQGNAAARPCFFYLNLLLPQQVSANAARAGQA